MSDIIWPTLLQFSGTVVKASAISSLAASTSHNLNSTLNFSSTNFTCPVISAWAFINFQSSNLGFKCATSGFCKKAFFSKGLNNPVLLKLFSTTSDIFSPNLLIFVSFFSSCLVSLSENRGDTAIGSGFRFPLVISTSIRECD